MRLEPHGWQFGARSGGETLTFVPPECVIRPLHDRLIVEPIDVVLSKIIEVPKREKPQRGVVLAAGPGKFRIAYDHPEKHTRKRMWETRTFVPTSVRVGDVVELGGSEQGGYAFDGFYWGERYVICCTERDVCGVVDSERVEPRRAAAG